MGSNLWQNQQVNKKIVSNSDTADIQKEAISDTVTSATIVLVTNQFLPIVLLLPNQQNPFNHWPTRKLNYFLVHSGYQTWYHYSKCPRRRPRQKNGIHCGQWDHLHDTAPSTASRWKWRKKRYNHHFLDKLLTSPVLKCTIKKQK